MMIVLRTAVMALLVASLAGCASTTTNVNASGSNHGAGASAAVGTGIKF